MDSIFASALLIPGSDKDSLLNHLPSSISVLPEDCLCDEEGKLICIRLQSTPSGEQTGEPFDVVNKWFSSRQELIIYSLQQSDMDPQMLMRLSCNDLDSFCWLSYTANINQEKVKEDDPSPKSLLLVLSCGGEVGLYDPLQGDRCMMRNNLKLTTVGWRICVPRRGSQCILWNARSESLFILDAVTLKLGEPLQLASAKDLIDLRIWQSNAAKKKATVNRDSSDPYGKSKIICLCADELVVFEWPEEQNKDLLALVRVQLTGNPPLRILTNQFTNSLQVLLLFSHRAELIGIPLTSEQSAAANTIMVKESVLLWKAQTQWSISSGFFVDPASIVLCSPGGAWAAFPNLQSNATNYEIHGNQGIVSNFIAFRGQQSTLCCYQRVSKQGYFSAIKWKAFRDLSNVPVIDSVAYGDQEITAKSFPTASTVIEDFKMAIGYSDGSIRITHLSYIYNDTPEGCIRELTGGHCCSITALFCPRFAGSDCGSTDSTADKQPDIYPWLLSGADDGTIVLWNYNDSSKLHKFYAHRSAVLSIGQPKLHSPPEERHRKANSGVKQTIASHAAKRKVYSLPSNSRTNSRGSIESSVDADDDQQNTQQPFEKLLNSVFSTGADGSLTALSLSPPSVEFTIDSDCITATPVTGLEISRPNFISVSRLSTPLPAETWTVDSDGFVVMSDDSRTKAETPVEASVVFGESLVEDITAIRTSWQTPIYALNLNNLLATSISVELETFFKCALRHLTASPRTLITWHSPIDSPLPVSFAPPFSRQSSKLYTFTLVCIGSIRYFINGRNVEESMDYVLQYSTSLAGVKQEPSFTLLALNLFNEDLSACPGPIQIVSRSIFRHFIKELPLISIKALIFKWFQALPSRSTTANDAYKSTKKLHLVFVLAALAVLEIEMSADERNKAILIDIEDLAAAPSHDGNDQQSSHEGHDDGRGRLVRLGRGIKKEIAFSIAVLLQSEQNTLADASMARLAIGFLVEGWDLWEPFLLASTSAQFSSLANKAPGRDLSATSAPATPVHLILIRKLFYLASLSNRSKHSKSSLFTKSSPKHNASPNGKDNEARAAISRFQLIPGRSFAVHEYRNAKTTSKSLGAVLAQAARNCLTRLAEKPVYLNTVCGELLISGLKDGNWERLWVTLKSGVGAIVKNGPSRLIANNLPRLLESIIKGCLDPSIPYDFREKILPTVTAILQELIRSHRTVSFHTQTQRLAVGTESTGESLSSKASLGPGQIIVWDLKTATRIQVIEAHCPHAITALSFNRNSVTANGNALLVSYSASENAVKFWQQPSGLLGALTSSLGRIGGERNQSNIFANLVTGGLFQVFRTFAVDGFDDASRNHSRFEWTSERSVRLLRELKSDLTFSV